MPAEPHAASGSATAGATSTGGRRRRSVRCSSTWTPRARAPRRRARGCARPTSRRRRRRRRTRVPERPGRALDPVDPPRGGAQDVLRQRERQADRREVGDQQVLDHVDGRELLAEPVDRRDQRDEQAARSPCPTGRARPTGAARAPPSAARCASARRRSSRRRQRDASTIGAQVSTTCRPARATIVTLRVDAAIRCDTAAPHAGHCDDHVLIRARRAVRERCRSRWRSWSRADRARSSPPACVACRRAARARVVAVVRRLRARVAVAARAGLRALRAAGHRGRGCPAAARGVRAGVGAAGLRGRGAVDLVAALKFRGALPVADLMAAHMAANLPGDLRAPASRSSRCRRSAARRRRRGFDPAAELCRRAGAAARAAGRARASCGATARAGRSAPRGRRGARPAGWRSSSAGHRRPPRCSSTTSTPPARRSTPAPARSAPAAARGGRDHLRADAVTPSAIGRRLAPVPPSRACGAISRLWRRLAAAVPAIAILYRQSR